MILYIVRHAWAGHAGDPRWPDDRQRPLSSDGRERMARLIKKLADRGFAPGLIVTSPFVRCHETAAVIAEGVSGKPQVVLRDELAAPVRSHPPAAMDGCAAPPRRARLGWSRTRCRIPWGCPHRRLRQHRFRQGGDCRDLLRWPAANRPGRAPMAGDGEDPGAVKLRSTPPEFSRGIYPARDKSRG